MAIKFAPPWLKALGSDSSPLVDDGQVQDQIVRLKLKMQQDERRQHGEMFSGPMVEPKASTAPGSPSVDDLTQPEPSPSSRDDRMTQPVVQTPEQPAPPAPSLTSPMPGAGGVPGDPGMARELPFMAPPGAPPPPPPADRPPGAFRFDRREKRPGDEPDIEETPR